MPSPRGGDVGGLVRQRRDELGITQDELAERVGKTQRWVSALETGRIGLPRTSTLHAMSRALGLPVSMFYVAATVARTAAEGQQIVDASHVAASDSAALTVTESASVVKTSNAVPASLQASFLRAGTLSPQRQKRLEDYIDELAKLDAFEFGQPAESFGHDE